MTQTFILNSSENESTVRKIVPADSIFWEYIPTFHVHFISRDSLGDFSNINFLENLRKTVRYRDWSYVIDITKLIFLNLSKLAEKLKH